MGFIQDFKKFAVKGNVIDLAVAVIIGKAFNEIVSALVADIIMPLVATLGSGEKISARFNVLKQGDPTGPYASLEQAKEAGANILAYGHFVQTIVDFLIIAMSIFVAIRVYKKLERKEEAKAPPPGPSSTDKLLMEIRDELKK